MEEGTPVLETFTETVADGPSQPLMRKLMSMMLSPDAPREDPEISGFFLVDTTPTPLSVGESSRQGADDISQTVGCPVEDMETVVQSGFRFAGAEGCCDSENYFTGSCIPADLAEKVPIDFLHAINNVLDTKVVPMHKTHHHGRRRNPKRTRGAPGLELPGASSGAAGYGQEMMLRRLDRLEEICLRTESYMHAVLGTIDRRLQLLESEALRLPTQDSACSPRFPGTGGFPTEAGTGGFSTEAGTFLTPDMFMVQSPHPDRSLFTAVVEVPDAGPAPPPEDAGICLSPIDTLPSPVVILASSLPAAVVLSSDVPVSHSEYPFTSAAAQEEQRPRAGLDEASATMAPPVLIGQEVTSDEQAEESGEREQVSAIAVFSLAPDAAAGDASSQQNPVDILLSEPVVVWENDGFPYLRPAYQFPTEPRLRDTTVLTWDAAGGYLSPESTSSEDDRATSLSSDDAFTFYNLEDRSGEEFVPQHLHSEEFHRKEEGMLEEISSILKNICTNLEVLRTPEQGADAGSSSTSGSCPHCSRGRQGVLTCTEEEEIFSVIEGMFSRLAFLPQPEDVLVNILPSDTKPEEAFQYAELPQSEQADSSSSEEAVPKVSLSFTQEEASSQDMRVHIDVPPLNQEPASKEPVTLHIAIAPKEIRVEPNTEQVASSVVQDICVSVDGPCQGPLVSESEHFAQELPPEPPREVVPVAKDKLELTGGILADYSLKVVPRSEGLGGESSAGSKVVSTEAGQEESMLINNEAVSSVIHELCFSLDVPTTAAKTGDAPDLPLQIEICLTGDSKTGTGVAVMNEQRPLIRDRPVQEPEVEAGQVASIVLSLEALKKAEEEPTCSKPGCSRRVPCGEGDCLLIKDEEITSIHQDVCISLEVPTAEEGSSDGVSGIQIGLAVKSVPTRRSDEEEEERSSYLISCVEISDDQEMEKAPFTEIPACVARVEQPSDEEELAPLKSKLEVEPAEEVVESIVAPPPSPVESAPETHDYLFKEEKKQPSDEWVIDSIYLPKENFQQVNARVPRPILRGMTPMDLVRGSLHFDGKACLLSICMDDLWTAEDMCQAPASAAAAIAKQKFQPLAVVSSAKKGGGSNQDSSCLRDMPAWLGDAFVDGLKPAAGEKHNSKSLTPAFGFRRQNLEPGQKQQPQQQQQQHPNFGFRPAAGVTPVFGFRNLSGKQEAKLQQQEQQQPQQQVETVFGFRNVVTKKPPLPPKPRMQVNVPVTADEEWDSSLSVVSRSPASHSRRKLPQDEQPPQTRVPDSPGAKNSLATAAAASSSSNSSSSCGYSPLVTSEEFEAGKPEAGVVVAAAEVIESTTPTAAVEAAVAVAAEEETGTRTAATGGAGVPPKMALDFLEAGGGSDEDCLDWSAELLVMPLDPFAAADVAIAAVVAGQDDTFFDALQCSGKHGAAGSNKLKKYLKDKVWNKLSCYGTGMPDSDSDNTSCHHHTT